MRVLVVLTSAVILCCLVHTARADDGCLHVTKAVQRKNAVSERKHERQLDAILAAWDARSLDSMSPDPWFRPGHWSLTPAGSMRDFATNVYNIVKREGIPGLTSCRLHNQECLAAEWMKVEAKLLLLIRRQTGPALTEGMTSNQRVDWAFAQLNIWLRESRWGADLQDDVDSILDLYGDGLSIGWGTNVAPNRRHPPRCVIED